MGVREGGSGRGLGTGWRGEMVLNLRIINRWNGWKEESDEMGGGGEGQYKGGDCKEMRKARV